MRGALLQRLLIVTACERVSVSLRHHPLDIEPDRTAAALFLSPSVAVTGVVQMPVREL